MKQQKIMTLKSKYLILKLFISLVAASLLHFNSCLIAQTTFQRTYEIGTSYDRAMDIRQTSDGGYIAVGNTYILGDGTKPNILLHKTDINGNVLWTKSYGGTKGDYGFSIDITTDGGYIITGITMSYTIDTGTYAQNLYVMKTDANGNKSWAKSYGGNFSRMGWRCDAIQTTSDGGYIVVGTERGIARTGGSVYLLKLDTSGDTLWTKSYYGTSGTNDGNAVRQTSDGGYIIVGSAANYLGNLTWDTYLIRTNSTGDTMWTKLYQRAGGTGNNIYGNDIQQTTDGGFIITGNITLSSNGLGNDCYLLKTDANGNVSWLKSFGGAANDYGLSVLQTSDGGYIMAGSMNAPYWLDEAYIVKTNATGTIQWAKSYGGIGIRAFVGSIQKTTDGGYILAGGSNNVNDTAGTGANILLLKIDANGNSGCDETIRNDIAVTRTVSEYSTGNVFAGGKYIDITPKKYTFSTFERRLCNPCSLVTTLSGKDVSCYGSSNGAIDQTPANGTLPYTYNWSNGDTIEDINNLSSGTYTVIVTDSEYCKAYDTITIASPPLLKLFLIPIAIDCYGDIRTIDINITGGTLPYTYYWSNSDTTKIIHLPIAGTYTVTVTDSNACTAIDSIIITEDKSMKLTANVTDVSCKGNKDGKIEITITGGNPGGYTYLWDSNTGNQTDSVVTGLSAGTYKVMVGDGSINYCTLTYYITVNDGVVLPKLDLGEYDTLFCGETLILDAGTSFDTYQWQDNSNASTYVVSETGTYYISAVFQGCETSDTTIIVVLPSPIIELGDDTILCEKEILLDAGSGYFSYLWQDGSDNQFYKANTDGQYYVTITDSYNCSASDTINLTFYCPNSNLWVPNVFTPNGDGANDLFPNGDGINDIFSAKGENILCYRLRIFNRWGELLFESDNINNGWDGTYKGNLVKDGVYVWTIKYCGYENNEETERELIGHVTVLK